MHIFNVTIVASFHPSPDAATFLVANVLRKNN